MIIVIRCKTSVDYLGLPMFFNVNKCDFEEADIVTLVKCKKDNYRIDTKNDRIYISYMQMGAFVT